MATTHYPSPPVNAPKTLTIVPYEPDQDVPITGRPILGQFDDDTIVVYQAFPHSIASEAVRLQQLAECREFKLTRMSWIKTSFAWMQYRSGWNIKPNQERTLAIRIHRSSFDAFVSGARGGDEGSSGERKVDSVRVQWDPDYRPYVATHRVGERRAIQLGLRGHALEHYASSDAIVSIEDITPFIIEMRERDPSDLWVPIQRVYDHPLYPATTTTAPV